MKYLLFLLFSILSWVYFAQKSKLIPSVINLKAKIISADTLYLFGENHYSFNADFKIDSLSYENENQFIIQKVDSNHFSIICNRNAYNSYFPITNLALTAYGKNNKTWKFTIPCKVYPPVKVKFIFAGEADINQNPIKNATSFRCKASWDCPKYLIVQQRLRGRFTINLKSEDTLLKSVNGWYDTGDMTQEIDLMEFKHYKNVTVEVQDNNLLTLHEDQLKTREKLVLSASTPKKLNFLFP